MRISSEGITTLVAAGLFAAFLGYLGYSRGNLVMIVVFWLNIAVLMLLTYFFRDPVRIPPDVENAIVSPADGKVVEIAEYEEPDFIEGKATRIAIFLSVFNVHVNYVPLGGTVELVKFKRGKFLPAFSPRASEENQYTLVGMETRYGKIAFKQSTGILARRIVCRLRLGDVVKTGHKYGIIKLGSRMEIYLPEGATVNVREGERLTAGESIIAYGNETQ